MTLPKQSLVLTSTDRTEIDKVLQALVGKVNIYEKLPKYLSVNCGYMLYYSIYSDTITVNNVVQSDSILCSTADEFLAHFEKPKEIRIDLTEFLLGHYAIVYENATKICQSNGVFITQFTTEELNQIINAQKELQ